MGPSSQQQLSRDDDTETSDDNTDTGPSRDELFHVLRNHRRRFVLHHLKHQDEPVDIGDLATQVAAWENNTMADDVTSTQRRRVYNSLQQTHIPKLNETNIADTERRTVELTDHAAQLDIYLEVVPGKDIPWSEYYLAIGGIGLAGITVMWLDIGPFAIFPDITAGIFLGIALMISAVVHYYNQHNDLIGETEKPPELREEL